MLGKEIVVGPDGGPPQISLQQMIKEAMLSWSQVVSEKVARIPAHVATPGIAKSRAQCEQILISHLAEALHGGILYSTAACLPGLR
jgi:hypothetical protein